MLSGRLRSLSIAAEAVKELLSLNRLVAVPPGWGEDESDSLPGVGSLAENRSREKQGRNGTDR